jgi:hypothetical protein
LKNKDGEAGLEKMLEDDCNVDNTACSKKSDDTKGGGSETLTHSKGLSEYKKNKAKNIAELKQELTKLKEQYPMPDD